MTAAKGFHALKLTGGESGAIVVDLDVTRSDRLVDVTSDPQFLGDAPVMVHGVCSLCGHADHFLDGVSMTARGFHRFDRSSAGGYFADELKENER